MRNESFGDSPEELHERAVAALVRVWGVSDADARAAIARVQVRERRLQVKEPVGLRHWTLDQQRRRAMDLAAFDESVRSPVALLGVVTCPAALDYHDRLIRCEWSPGHTGVHSSLIDGVLWVAAMPSSTTPRRSSTASRRTSRRAA